MKPKVDEKINCFIDTYKELKKLFGNGENAKQYVLDYTKYIFDAAQPEGMGDIEENLNSDDPAKRKKGIDCSLHLLIKNFQIEIMDSYIM